MERDITRLTEGVFDLCVVGGGIYGACVAWDAALRGLSVALVEQGDFGHATSANSQKVIHGGLRYLQDGDLPRVMESVRERAAWLRIAPHLVHPLPFLLPTFKSGGKPREIIYAALVLYDLLSAHHRHRPEDVQKHIPGGRLLSRDECLESLPGLDSSNLSGGVIFHDAQMYSSERLLLSIIMSAARAGASVANHVAAAGFLLDGRRVTGIKARDVLTGEEFDVKARVVVNAVGPWLNQMMGRLHPKYAMAPVLLCQAMNLVVKGTCSTSAFALQGARSRLFFATPWRQEFTLIGTAQVHYEGDADGFRVQEEHIQGFIAEINHCRPELALRREDVVAVHGGLVPADESRSRVGDLQISGRNRIIDHRIESGLEGLVSLVGTKYTTARAVAQRAVNLAFDKMGYPRRRSTSAATPVHGGDTGPFADFLDRAIAQKGPWLGEDTVRHLVHNYGSYWSRVLECPPPAANAAAPLPGNTRVLAGEVVHGVREEMARKLADVVFRRTELGLFGHPGEECLSACAGIMADELGWDASRTQRELEEVRSAFSLGAVHA